MLTPVKPGGPWYTALGGKKVSGQVIASGASATIAHTCSFTPGSILISYDTGGHVRHTAPPDATNVYLQNTGGYSATIDFIALPD